MLFSKIVRVCFLRADCIDGDVGVARAQSIRSHGDLSQVAAALDLGFGRGLDLVAVGGGDRLLPPSYELSEGTDCRLGRPLPVLGHEGIVGSRRLCQHPAAVFAGRTTSGPRPHRPVHDLLYVQAVKASVEFVSPVAVWDGHEPCGEKANTQLAEPVSKIPNPIDGGCSTEHGGQKTLAALTTCYLTFESSVASAISSWPRATVGEHRRWAVRAIRPSRRPGFACCATRLQQHRVAFAYLNGGNVPHALRRSHPRHRTDGPGRAPGHPGPRGRQRGLRHRPVPRRRRPGRARAGGRHLHRGEPRRRRLRRRARATSTTCSTSRS